MDVQTILVFAIFFVAVFFLGRMFFRNISPKKSCGGNCKCGIDFSEIEKQEINK